MRVTMTKRDSTIRVPIEFKNWLIDRKVIISRSHNNLLSRGKKKLKLTNIMRILSKIDGINCDPMTMNKLICRELRIRRRK